MKKIIHIITGLSQGGAEAMLYKLVSNMDRAKFQNMVVSMRCGGIYEEKLKKINVDVYTLEITKSPISVLSALIQYKKMIKQFNPDVIQSWMYHANFFSALYNLFSLNKKPIIFNVRQCLPDIKNEKYLTQLMVRVNGYFTKKTKAVINNSRLSQKQHHKYGFNPSKDVYIPNGFDVNQYKPSVDVYSGFRKKHGLKNSLKLVGLVARYHPVKNHRRFLEIATAVLEKNVCDIKFVLAGKGCDDKNTELVKLIRKYNLMDSVILLGQTPSEKIIPAFDLLLLTSDSEGFPNVVGEAMSCDIPCITTDVGDCKEVIGGFGCSSNLESELVDSICSFLLSQGSLHVKNSIRSHVVNNYSIEKIVTKYEYLYEKVCSKG